MHKKSWNEPKQARSQERFAHILQTAARLFGERGYESVTTNHIAAEAAVSIGALYRFFPNKEAILDALIAGYMSRMAQVFPKTLDLERPYPEVLEELLRQIAAMEAQESAFGHIFVYVDNAQTVAIHHALVQQVARLIGAYYPQLQGEALTRCAAVGAGIVKGLMPLLGEMGMETAVVEMKRALLAYLNACLEEVA